MQLVQFCINGLALLGGLCVLCCGIMTGIFTATSIRLRNELKESRDYDLARLMPESPAEPHRTNLEKRLQLQ